MPHVIRKKRLHIEFHGPESEVAALQRRLERFCYDSLLPVMEVALNEHAAEDEHILLEEVVIDAGTIPLDQMEADLSQAVQEGMQQALGEELQSPRINSRRRNKLQAMTEVFMHFLEQGSLPWWFQLQAGKELEQVLLECWLDESLPYGAAVITLEEVLIPLQKESARRRLILQFSERFRSLLLPIIAPQVGIRVAAVLERLSGVALPSTAVAPIREKVWDNGLAAAANHVSATEHELISRAWLGLPEWLRRHPEVSVALERHWPGAVGSSKPEATVEDLKSATHKQNEEPSAGHAEKIEGADKPEAVQEGIYIENGGVVLLHPYLTRLFEALEISSGNHILTPERGVAVLHYLASGSTEPPEYLVALQKILCSIPLHIPIARNIELTELDIEMCDSLLKALLQHWGALRNSSVNGLRGAFLMRPAKLTLRDNDEWLLQVEKNSCDILLDQLPFSISMVKLPWMEKLLWVQWD
ncbi:contractile injection system tape measure protein [Geomonas edaphica]|uniref:contractile injection system tape measure protein n=1 Tax=Geomonas edaphica TaxID=2570226 RepID=UPI0010A8AE26|nr:contractile injection system tape measure protein [Geomonas edaphica]